MSSKKYTNNPKKVTIKNSNYEYTNTSRKRFKFINDIAKDSYTHYIKWNTFCYFKSIDDIYYLIYSNINRSILFYNLIDNKKISEIKKAHLNQITNFRHHFDIKNERDLIISISLDDNNIKLWNVNNLLCLLNIENVNKEGGLLSACFLNDNNNIYIVTSNQNSFGIEPIKVFDLNGKIIKIINDSKNNTQYIDTYYDNKSSKIYILTGNDNLVQSFDFNKNIVYKKYKDEVEEIYGKYHNCLNINEKEELLESSEDGKIRIWNFHSALLLKVIKINQDSTLDGFCLWNKEYICVSYEDKAIKIVDLKNGKIIEELKGHNIDVTYLKKIAHPVYGECLISQGWRDDSIKLWENINN